MTTFIKTKFKKSDDQTIIDKYRVAANITEYFIKKIFFRIVIPKFFMIRQLSYIENLCQNVKNQHVQNGRMVFLVTIRTCQINERPSDGRADPNYRKTSFLKTRLF